MPKWPRPPFPGADVPEQDPCPLGTVYVDAWIASLCLIKDSNLRALVRDAAAQASEQFAIKRGLRDEMKAHATFSYARAVKDLKDLEEDTR